MREVPATVVLMVMLSIKISLWAGKVKEMQKSVRYAETGY